MIFVYVISLMLLCSVHMHVYAAEQTAQANAQAQESEQDFQDYDEDYEDETYDDVYDEEDEPAPQAAQPEQQITQPTAPVKAQEEPKKATQPEQKPAAPAATAQEGAKTPSQPEKTTAVTPAAATSAAPTKEASKEPVVQTTTTVENKTATTPSTPADAAAPKSETKSEVKVEVKSEPQTSAAQTTTVTAPASPAQPATEAEQKTEQKTEQEAAPAEKKPAIVPTPAAPADETKAAQPENAKEKEVSAAQAEQKPATQAEQESKKETKETSEPKTEEHAAQADAQEKKEKEAQPSLPVLPPAPEKRTAPAYLEEDTGEIKGIDTVDVESPEGNWLFKRIWWEKSNNLYGKIRATVDQISDARLHFYKEHVRVARDLLDPFYATVGFDQGKLTEMADMLVAQLDKKRKQKNVLDETELEYYTILINAREIIQEFNIAVKSVGQLSNDLSDALLKLVEQLNKARSYESEAWRLLNEIAQELSDKKARESYYAVVTQWQNIKDIYAYIVGPYSQHFGQLVTTLSQKTKEISASIEDLKDKGVKFEQQVQEHLADEAESCPTPQEEKAPAKQKSWWQSLYATVAGWFGY